jgi:hypothetical protein
MPMDVFMVLPSAAPSPLGTVPITADPTVDPYFKTTFGTQPVVELRSFSLGVENSTTFGSATATGRPPGGRCSTRRPSRNRWTC